MRGDSLRRQSFKSFCGNDDVWLVFLGVCDVLGLQMNGYKMVVWLYDDLVICHTSYMGLNSLGARHFGTAYFNIELGANMHSCTGVYHCLSGKDCSVLSNTGKVHNQSSYQIF